jgi:signal peptidase II
VNGVSGGYLAALTALLVLVADQATKALVRSEIARGDDRDLLLGARLVHVRNDGVAFGQLGGSGVLVAIVVAAALVGLLVYFALHRDMPYIWLPTGLLLGGALGNLVDRAHAGAVTDWIKLPRWPAFNVADIAITTGVISLLIVVELDARRRSRAPAPGPDERTDEAQGAA